MDGTDAMLPTGFGHSVRRGISGFGAGVIVETSEGPQPVEWLRPGDLVLTRDNGYRPLKWVGRTGEVDEADHPLRIFARSLGNRLPEHDLILSPHHHLLMRSPQLPLHFGEEEVISPLSSVATEAEFDFDMQRDFKYSHLVFDTHELVLAEGVWVESFMTDPQALARLGLDAEEEIRFAIGAKTDEMITARLTLTQEEVCILQPRSAIAASRMVA